MIKVDDARRILGEKVQAMSDSKIQKVLDFLYFICEKVIRSLNKIHE